MYEAREREEWDRTVFIVHKVLGAMGVRMDFHRLHPMRKPRVIRTVEELGGVMGLDEKARAK